MTHREILALVCGFFLGAMVGTCSMARAEPFLDLALGATVFVPTTSDGVWYQEAFPHHFNRTDVAVRAGLGWRFNDRWRTTMSYLRLGSVHSTAAFVFDADYDPIAHRCLARCDKLNHLVATDAVQGG